MSGRLRNSREMGSGTIEIEATSGPLGAIASGLYLQDELDQPTLSLIRTGLAGNLVLVFRGQFQILHAVELPDSGGAPYWADTYSAFERLPPLEREYLEGLRVVPEGQGETYYHHSVHPLVVTNPEHGRRTLFLTKMFSTRVLGIPATQSDELLDRLCAHATTADLVYRHDWMVGDLVVWDAIGTLHRRDAFDPSSRRYLRGLCTLAAE